LAQRSLVSLEHQRIVESSGCRRQAVEVVVQRFVEAGFEDTGKGKQHPQPVMQILLDEKQVAKVNVCRVCSAPKGYANWTLRLLTRRGLELFFLPLPRCLYFG